MKCYAITFLLLAFAFLVPQKAEAQFLKKLKNKTEKKINYEADKRSTKRAYNAVDDVFDKAEGLLDKAFSKKKKKKNSNSNRSNTNNRSSSKSNNQSSSNSRSSTKSTTSKNSNSNSHQPKVVWSKFDFVPGDQVIFEDGPAISEENGEFPSRWDLEDGNAEIAEVDGVNVIVFPHGGAIVPYLKNPKEDYLPDVFTIEFDAYFDANNHHRFWIYLYDKKNQSRNGGSPVITFYPASAHFR